MAKRLIINEEQENDIYRQQRDRNNISVRKSRAKSKQKLEQTKERIKKLRCENENLSKEMSQLTKELTILKHLVEFFVRAK